MTRPGWRRTFPDASSVISTRVRKQDVYCDLTLLPMKSLSGSSKLGSENSAGADLAILSLCNHLVLSRGTFGAWASFLSGDNHILNDRMWNMLLLISHVSGSHRIVPKHFDANLNPFLASNQVPLFDLSQR